MLVLAGCADAGAPSPSTGQQALDEDSAAMLPSEQESNTPDIELTTEWLDPEFCKIEELSEWRHERVSPGDVFKGNATAFPFNPTALPFTGELNVAMVFIDWEDLRGTSAEQSYYLEQAQLFEDFYAMASENTLDVVIHPSSEWFTIPEPYRGFVTEPEDEAQRGEAPKKQVFYDAAVAASDASFDYSDMDVVFFGIPTGPQVFANGLHEFNID